MRNKIPLFIAAYFVCGVAIVISGSSKSVTVTGWVSDEACGAEHTKPGGTDCVLKCLRGGAHVGHPEWKPQRMVLVTDKSKRIWIVENPEALKGFEGLHVKISGRLNAARKTVRIDTASELKP